VIVARDDLVRLAAWVAGTETVFLTIGAFASRRVASVVVQSPAIPWLVTVIVVLVIPFGTAALLTAQADSPLRAGTVSCIGVLVGSVLWAVTGRIIGIEALSETPSTWAWRSFGFAIIVAACIFAVGAISLRRS
jgi:hypothetical protein